MRSKLCGGFKNFNFTTNFQSDNAFSSHHSFNSIFISIYNIYFIYVYDLKYLFAEQLPLLCDLPCRVRNELDWVSETDHAIVFNFHSEIVFLP